MRIEGHCRQRNAVSKRTGKGQDMPCLGAPVAGAEYEEEEQELRVGMNWGRSLGVSNIQWRQLNFPTRPWRTAEVGDFPHSAWS